MSPAPVNVDYDGQDWPEDAIPYATPSLGELKDFSSMRRLRMAGQHLSPMTSMANLGTEYTNFWAAPTSRSTYPESPVWHCDSTRIVDATANISSTCPPRKPVSYSRQATLVAGVPVAYAESAFMERVNAAAGRYQDRPKSAMAERRDMRRASMRLASGGDDQLF